MAELNWTDAQWQKVKDSVTDAFGKTSVAAAFLPCYGPLAGSAEIVRNERLLEDDSDTPTIKLDADHDAVNLKLVNLTVRVELSSEQVADETLANAILAFRRAASIIAQEEDRIVFGGFARGFLPDNSRFVANAKTVKPQKGLADLTARTKFDALQKQGVSDGQALVAAVVDAIQDLENRLHPAPFACVLGSTLFDKAHDPAPSLALPADRITPHLKGGPLLRSGRIDANTGIVVSLAGNAVDIVVGTPPTVQFLQRKEDAKFLFRVYERFALRIREDPPPVAGFRIKPDTAQTGRERKQLTLLRRAAKV